MDWVTHYPAYSKKVFSNMEAEMQLVGNVEVADIGCGFGGLLVALSPVLPDTLMIGTRCFHP